MKTLSFLAIVALCFIVLSIAVVNGFNPYSQSRNETRIVEPVPIPDYIPPSEQQIARKLLNYKELQCLAKNIYFEARGESDLGKLAVGIVVKNRTLSPYYPDTYCEVVHQSVLDSNGNPVLNECQFSWYCDRKTDNINWHNPIARREYRKSVVIAEHILLNRYEKNRNFMGITSYHADYVNPYWAHSPHFKLVTKVGVHMFYRRTNVKIPSLDLASLN